MLKDRRRAQRGSVLSGVLIMTAFIAIIVGALMTELSTSFLLSHAETTRLANQATINSALESSMNQLSTTPIASGCPGLNPINLNGRWAVPSYTGCWPAVRETPDYFTVAGTSGAFSVDGTHSVVNTTGGQSYDLYLAGNSAGQLWEFDFASQARHTLSLPGAVSGPSVALPDPVCCSNRIAFLVPLSITSSPPPGCSTGYCVAFTGQDGLGGIEGQCYLGAAARVTARPAGSVSNPNVYFFGDRNGALYAYTASEGGICGLLTPPTTGGKPIVAGPVVFRNPNQSSTDELFAVAADGSGSSLVHYEFVKGKKSTTLTQVGIQPLLSDPATGLAVNGSSVPAAAVVATQEGTVALVQIRSDFTMSPPITTYLGSQLNGPPSWCCGPSPSRIGVARNDGLSVLDTNLNVVTSYSPGVTVAGGAVADAGGDWFFGATDGNVYEIPQISSASTALKLGSGQLGRLVSTIGVGPCAAGICIFAPSTNQNVYQVQLDARLAAIAACIAPSATSPCSGAKPVLRAQIEVGSSASKNSVHVQGWSYYSG